MPILKRSWQPVAVGCLACLIGCGGGSSSSTGSTSTAASSAQALAYTAPTSTGYRLVRNASSTSTHLVLDLVGPSGTQIQGGLFTFSADSTKATWGNPGGSDTYVLEGSALSLGTGIKLLKSQMSGQTLTAAIYQKGSTAAATLGSAPVLSVALDLKSGASVGSLSLTCTYAQTLDASGTKNVTVVAAGTAVAQ